MRMLWTNNIKATVDMLKISLCMYLIGVPLEKTRSKVCDNKEICKEYIEEYVLSELERKIFKRDFVKEVIVYHKKIYRQ